jgi:hypothetical protein
VGQRVSPEWPKGAQEPGTRGDFDRLKLGSTIGEGVVARGEGATPMKTNGKAGKTLAPSALDGSKLGPTPREAAVDSEAM